MFDASLRKRPVWKSLGPLVASSAELRLRESDLRTHDFSIPFSYPRSIGGKQLRVLLITPSAVEDSNSEETISRLNRFSHLTGGHDIAIVFLQSEDSHPATANQHDLHALLKLQAILLQHIAVPIPILTVQHVDDLLPSLRSYIKNLEKATEMSQTLSPLSAIQTTLLSHATTSSPLSEHDTNILSDLFPSFRALSQAAVVPEGREIIREYFDNETARGIIGFWYQ